MIRFVLSVLALSLALVAIAVLGADDPAEVRAAARPLETSAVTSEEAPAAMLPPLLPAPEVASPAEGVETGAATPVREAAPVGAELPGGQPAASGRPVLWGSLEAEGGQVELIREAVVLHARLATDVSRVQNFKLLLEEGDLIVLGAETPPDGLHTEWYVEGEVRAAEGQIRNGKREGLWTESHQNGERSGEGRYFHGDRHGPWTFWFGGGDVKSNGEYLYGEREGLWTDYHDGGGKHRVGPYRNGRAEGPTTWRWPDGSKQEEGSFSDDLREGRWMWWFQSGAIGSEGDYHYGKRHGRWRFYAEDGTLDAEQSGWYEAGERKEE